MQLAAARVIALVLMGGGFASVAQAEIIRASGTFGVHLRGDDTLGDVFDPPLVGSGSFEIRSRPYDPDEVFEGVFDFDVLDFSFSIGGFTWDESELTQDFCCVFTAEGQPDSILFEFDNGVARGHLVWGDGEFAMSLFAPNLESHGASDTFTAGSELDVNSVVLPIPEPGSLALLGLGLLGLGLRRRRTAN